MDKGSGWKGPDLPDYAKKNILEILADAGENGIEIADFSHKYFTKYTCSIYVQRYGFQDWGEVLRSPMFVPHATFFQNGTKVRESRFTSSNTTTIGTSGGSGAIQPPGVVNLSAKPLIAQPLVLKRRSSVLDPAAGGGGGAQIPGAQYINLGGSKDANFLRRPNPPVILSDSEDEASNSEKRRKIAETIDEEQPEECSTESGASEALTDLTHASITSENKVMLASERRSIRWIPRETGSCRMDFNALVLERELCQAQPEKYLDTTFCDRRILEVLVDVKSVIKKVNSDRYAAIRKKHNAFEFEKGKTIFQHGSAIIMANIDALMGYGLSNPKNSDGSNMLLSNELLYFADVNGGPGGFVEYFLWKKKWAAKGFGISPRLQKFDYNLQPAEHFPRESFEPYYGGDTGMDGDGRIDRPFTVSKFISFIKESTDDKGVHFMIGSGGDTDEYVDEDQRELRCKYTFMAQLLVALKIIRPGGHYVTKIYDMYTPFTVGLIYMMYRTFDQIAIFKPESSLLASSEKYIICKWKKPDSYCTEISNYLGECHKLDWLSHRSSRGSTQDYADIVHLLHPERVKDSFEFYDYIKATNAELARRQILEARTLTYNIRDHQHERVIEDRLRQIYDKCLAQWGVPKKVRDRPKYSKAKTTGMRAMKLSAPYPFDFISKTETDGEVDLLNGNMTTELKRSKEWRFMAVGKNRGFFMCLGGDAIYKFNKDGNKWIRIQESMELMNNTLVYGDLVDEIYCIGAKQSRVTALHIIDAMILGGKDIRVIPYNERYDMISKYAMSLNKMSREDLAPIRVKLSYDLNFGQLQRLLEMMSPLRNHGQGSEIVCPVDLHRSNDAQLIPDGILFFKVLKENFAAVDFRFCLQNRVFWRFYSETDLTVPKDLKTYEPVVNIGQIDENGDEKPLVHAVNVLRHVKNC